MKNLNFRTNRIAKGLALMMLAVFSVVALKSCNDERVEEPNTTTEVFSKKLTVEVANAQGKVVPTEITFSATYDNETDEFSDYRLAKQDYAKLGITEQEFNDELEKYFSPSATGKSIAECTRECWEQFTTADGEKIKGRGACRFDCYADKIIEVISKLI